MGSSSSTSNTSTILYKGNYKENIKMKLFYLVCMIMSTNGLPTTPRTSNVEFTMDEIKTVADYNNLCYTCSAILIGVEGRLEKPGVFTLGNIECVIKVTKNYLGPKIEYLLGL